MAERATRASAEDVEVAEVSGRLAAPVEEFVQAAASASEAEADDWQDSGTSD